MFGDLEQVDLPDYIETFIVSLCRHLERFGSLTEKQLDALRRTHARNVR